MNLIMQMLFYSMTSFLISHTSPQDTILGTWLAADLENATVEIYQEKNGLAYGKITACDKKEWIGEIILRALKYDDSKKQWKGEIYSPKRKMTINATVSTASDNKLKVVGKKYLMSKTFYWTKQ